MKKIREAVEFLEEKLTQKPAIGLILGSGLGVLAEEIKDPVRVKYEEIPDFPVSTVEGHRGQFVAGRLEGKDVIAMQGRFHYYEGYSMEEIVRPVRVMKMLGIENLIITNAAGGINLNFSPGEFMIIADHINLMGDSPLRGKNIGELGPRFPDMTRAYDEELIALAEKSAAEAGILIRKGIYAGTTGPNYETPAEIRFMSSIGADAVGMSTVPEVIAASHMGIAVLGISCITNMAAGVLPEPLDHEEVMEIAGQVKPVFINLIRKILQNAGC